MTNDFCFYMIINNVLVIHYLEYNTHEIYKAKLILCNTYKASVLCIQCTYLIVKLQSI